MYNCSHDSRCVAVRNRGCDRNYATQFSLCPGPLRDDSEDKCVYEKIGSDTYF